MIPFLISLAFSILYISMQTLSIYAGDSGELVAASYTWSIAHPPGYPLYTLLGGILTHGIPFYTVAWRVGLLSSIPMAVSLFFVWKTIFFLTRSKIASSLASVLFGLLYPVWLYAIVPEVFGLFSLFSACILYLFILFIETKKPIHVFLLAFFSGLALTHHHLILLLLFSMTMSLFYSYKKVLVSQIKNIWKLLALLFLGFSVYLYAPIVSSQYPPFDWEHPASPMGFFRLVTRASYGTFKATYGAGESIIDRGLNIFTLGQYILKDFTVLGILVFFIGLIALWKKNQSYGLFFLVYLGWQFFYFFYAGFSLTSDFALGTLERFFIIPYQIISICIGVGIWGLLEMLKAFWRTHRSETHIPFIVVKTIVILLSLVIPFGLVRHYYKPLKLLQQDQTLEKLADDVFKSAPEGSIVNLSDDTSSFAVYYAYYVQKKRQDVKLLLFPLLKYSYYPAWIKKQYADISIPSTPAPLPYAQYLAQFLQANYSMHPIISERVDASVPEHWVPRGLMVMYYPTLDDIPPRGQILAKNVSLWETFQDPLSGVIGTYKHLMLSDVLRYYANKRLTLAQSFLFSGNVDLAQKEMKEALRLTPDRLELFVPYIETLISNKKCLEAKELLGTIKNRFVPDQIYVGIYHRLYLACRNEDPSLESFEETYQKFIYERGIKIEE